MPPSSLSSSNSPIKYRRVSGIYQSRNFCIEEPENFDKAIKEVCWKKAMEDEINIIKKNKTLVLVEKPKGKEFFS